MKQIELLLGCLTDEEIKVILGRVESIKYLGKEDTKYDELILELLKEMSKRKKNNIVDKINKI